MIKNLLAHLWSWPIVRHEGRPKQSPSSPSLNRPASARGFGFQRMQQLWGVLFVLPALAFFIGFRLYPMLRAFEISFQQHDLLTPGKFVGFANYRYALTDQQTLNSFVVTIRFVILQTIPIVLLSLVLALLLNEVRHYRRVYEIAFYSPVIMTMVVASLIWLTLYYPRSLLDQIVEPFAPRGLPWLTNSYFAMFSVIAVDIWKSTGYYMVIFLAGLLAIPVEYYEAAKLDGAGYMHRFRYVTWPLLKPQTLFVIVILLIRTLQSFDSFYILTGGGPGDATRVLAIQIYQRAFQFFQMGRASAMSILLFFVLIILTLMQMRILRSEDD